MKARDLPSVEFQADFYPTPPEVAAKLTKDIDWNQVKTVLEPSAGRGDLAEFVGNALAKSIYTVYFKHAFRRLVSMPHRMTSGARS